MSLLSREELYRRWLAGEIGISAVVYAMEEADQ